MATHKANLRKDFIERLPIPATGRDSYFDTEVPGLRLVVFPSGKKSFRLEYRDPKGVRKSITLGRWGDITVTEARTRASKNRNTVGEGIDPLEVRRAARVKGQTLADFWPRYRAHGAKRWKPSSLAENDRLFDKYVGPALGNKPVADLATRDIRLFHESRSKTPFIANRCLALIRAMWNTAKEWEEVEGENPASRVKPYKEQARERFLTGEEVARLFDAIAEEEAAGGKSSIEREGKAKGRGGKGMTEKSSRGVTTHVAALFRLLVFTGARLGEIQHARWEYVRWDDKVLSLPDSKTGAKRILLPQPAIDELARLDKIKTGPWIIEGEVPGQALVNPQKPWRRIRKRAGLENVRIHDLRHSLASLMVSTGASLPLIGGVLGHRNHSTTARYSHLSVDPVRAALDRAVEAIQEARKAPPAKVVPVNQEVDDTKQSGTS
jgi:integrase